MYSNTYPSPKTGAVLPVLRVTIHYIKMNKNKTELIEIFLYRLPYFQPC